MARSFDWFKNESVVVKEVAAIAVYRNPDGDIVIRQRGDPMMDDDDNVVVVPVQRAKDLIEALRRETKD